VYNKQNVRLKMHANRFKSPTKTVAKTTLNLENHLIDNLSSQIVMSIDNYSNLQCYSQKTIVEILT